ncbi:MAG TPA: hypothetical protein VF894_11955 [Anaeromyxobacter sp.]
MLPRLIFAAIVFCVLGNRPEGAPRRHAEKAAAAAAAPATISPAPQ